MKRYYPENTDSGMFEYEDGPYVKYEDAAELQRQVEYLTKERDTLHALLAVADARINRLVAERDGK